MKIDDFLNLIQKLKRFKIRLEQEGITGEQLQVILKIYIQDITDNININMLEVI